MTESPGRPWTQWAVLSVATVGFLGWAPYHLVPHKKWKGGGLLGTLAGAALLWEAPTRGPLLWALFGIVLLVSIVTSHWAEKWLSLDDPRIVIDEVAGVWTACLLLPRLPAPFLLGAFFFRVFDVFKGPWGRAVSRLPGGWGVVADDLVAGVIAFFLTKGITAAFL